MNKARKLVEEMSDMSAPFTNEEVVSAFTKRLGEFGGFKGVTVDYAEVNSDGTVAVGFSDTEGDRIDVVFTFDANDGAVAFIPATEEDDEGELEVDLNPLDPPTIAGDVADFLDLTNLGWMNKTTLMSILAAGQVGEDVEESLTGEDRELTFNFDEAAKAIKIGAVKKGGGTKVGRVIGVKMVMRGGKATKIPVIKWTGRESAAQMAGHRKAAAKPRRAAAIAKAARSKAKGQAKGLYK